MISFTGGTATGRAIAGIAAQRTIPTALELGGKSPQIVFADADLDKAVDGIAGGIFASTGQSCIAGSRLFVERSAMEPLLQRLVAKAQAMRMGAPDDPASVIGPIASFG